MKLLVESSNALLDSEEELPVHQSHSTVNQLAYELKSKQRKLAQKKHYSLNANKVKCIQ